MTPGDTVDVGDHLVVVNSDFITLTGRKWDHKLYKRHTGYPGGLKEELAKRMHDRDQTLVSSLSLVYHSLLVPRTLYTGEVLEESESDPIDVILCVCCDYMVNPLHTFPGMRSI